MAEVDTEGSQPKEDVDSAARLKIGHFHEVPQDIVACTTRFFGSSHILIDILHNAFMYFSENTNVRGTSLSKST